MTKQQEDEAFEAYANGVDTERGVPTERSGDADNADTEPCPPPTDPRQQLLDFAWGYAPLSPLEARLDGHLDGLSEGVAERNAWIKRQADEAVKPRLGRADYAAGDMHIGRFAWADEAVPAPKSESSKRKDAPVFSGFLQYFPDAIREAARLSKLGNDKHNPGQPLHWSKGKSADHGDCLVRHQMEIGSYDPSYPGEKIDHAVAVFWRAGAQLQTLLEARAAAKKGAK